MKVAGWRVGTKYWKASHKCWFMKLTQPGGLREDRRLDSDEDAAEKLRCVIIASLEEQGTPSRDYPVRALCNLFLEHVAANNSPKTYKCYRSFLRSFASSIPATLRVRDFKHHHLENWLTRRYPASGNTTTRHDAVAAIKRIFGWAIEMQYLETSPLARFKSPAAKPRDACLSKDQWAQVLSYYDPADPFHDFLQFSLQTGCRPQEARVVEARHVDWKAKKIHFADGEVPGKKGSRDILLTDAAFAILQRCALKCPSGPLLRNEDGGPWTTTALVSRFRRLRKKVAIPAHCYLTRHTTATELLEAGASAGAVAAILGHRDASMVLKSYGRHIERREGHLRDCLERAVS